MMKEGERFHLGRRGGFHRGEAGPGEWQDLDRLRGGERAPERDRMVHRRQNTRSALNRGYRKVLAWESDCSGLQILILMPMKARNES